MKIRGVEPLKADDRDAPPPQCRDDRAAVPSPAGTDPRPHAAGLRCTARRGPGRTHTGCGLLYLESKSRAWLMILNGTNYFVYVSFKAQLQERVF